MLIPGEEPTQGVQHEIIFNLYHFEHNDKNCRGKTTSLCFPWLTNGVFVRNIKLLNMNLLGTLSFFPLCKFQRYNYVWLNCY